ncbi:M1 family metallopeptidase [Streptomyces sp. TRM66268-LWL]|uniref:Aminopeptidase N n=1 Tax=Streptomyces polyasparticus TaxID=2767826 RepID=A0ABR7SM44_9ACTN|nr:M1 family metallopeptidase [Streptomyces polyasparticus]MBC9716556.1 M1 family metallopeptidase [Streptomyces polyasparticus]
MGAVVSGLLLVSCAGSGVQGTPGTPGLRDPYFRLLGNGGYDATHYAIDLAYDPDESELSGEAVITAKAGKSLSAFNLDLHGLDVESVTVDDKPARFNRAADELTVRPDDEIPKGSTFTTRVVYSGEPETITDDDGSEEGWLYTDDGALALGEPAGSKAWFPGNHHPSDKAAYDIAITVPDGLEAVSNGELRSEKPAGSGRTTFAWHSAEPMASYVATVAIGPYETKTSTTDDGLPVFTAVAPAEAEESAEVLARIPEIMKWSEGRFGPYPFSSTGAIIDREGAAGYALETQTKPVFPGAPDLETLVHELAHQWYGNSVTPKTWQDMWLNEGFATYAEWLWAEDHDGDTAQETFDALYESDDPELWAFPPAEPTDASVISDTPVYERGAMVLHKVREAMGDEPFFSLMKDWAADHRHGNADTDDFTAYAEKAAGKNLDAVWGPWLYGDGKPKSP